MSGFDGRIPLRPYVLASGPTLEAAVAGIRVEPPLVVDAASAAGATFARLVNAGNAVAFDDLAMPAWVQLDCCTLAGAMFGYATTPEHIPRDVWGNVRRAYEARFGDDLRTYDGPVPVSEFCALPTTDPDEVVGVSLFSLVRGKALGLRSKALGLRALRARRQRGVTQYGNRALCVHARLGPLRIVAPRAPLHTHGNSFVYSLDVPPLEHLDAILRGEKPADPAPPADAHRVPVDDRVAERVAEIWRLCRDVRIVAPALIPSSAAGELELVLSAGRSSTAPAC